MKKMYVSLAVAVAAVTGAFAQTTVVADASAEFLAFANVSELPSNGGAYVFGSPWGVEDVKTVIDAEAGTITLQPNFNTYADNPDDEFWVNQETGEGNKLFEGNTFVESTDLVGEELTFTGGVESYTLDPAYVVEAFIKVFNADFSVLKEETTPLVEGQDFSITYTDVEAEDFIVQYGYKVTGANANPADEAALGSVVIVPTVLSVNENNAISVNAFPNPVTNTWSVETKDAIEVITVLNVTGQEVLRITPDSPTYTVDTSSLNAGIYLATVSTSAGSKTMKLIKK